jgi:branched-chain amino acid transport system substrate-binding protein
VELVVHDDASTRAGAAAGTDRLIVADRVDLLFGPYSSVLTIAAAEVSERHGRVLWNHGGSSDALDERGFARFVTLLTPASRYFEPVLEMVVDASAMGGRVARTVALAYGAAGTFPKAVAEGARRQAGHLGLLIVYDGVYPAPVDELARLRPDIVLGVGTTEADLKFAQEIRRQRPAASVTALVAAPIEHFRDELGADADGFCGPSQWEPTLQGQPDLGPRSADFAASFRRRFGVEADYPAAQAYAAGLVAAECVRRAGSLDDAALRAAAGTLDLTTFYGRFRLDPATGQQVGHQMVVVQWQASRKQVVWPPAAAGFQLPVPTAAPTLRPFDDSPS